MAFTFSPCSPKTSVPWAADAESCVLALIDPLTCNLGLLTWNFLGKVDTWTIWTGTWTTYQFLQYSKSYTLFEILTWSYRSTKKNLAKELSLHKKSNWWDWLTCDWLLCWDWLPSVWSFLPLVVCPSLTWSPTEFGGTWTIWTCPVVTCKQWTTRNNLYFMDYYGNHTRWKY